MSEWLKYETYRLYVIGMVLIRVILVKSNDV